jgi:hypothetical protein
MSELERVQIKAHRDNLKRYRRILSAKKLGDPERLYIKNRIAEERAELERLKPTRPYQQATQFHPEKRADKKLIYG